MTRSACSGCGAAWIRTRASATAPQASELPSGGLSSSPSIVRTIAGALLAARNACAVSGRRQRAGQKPRIGRAPASSCTTGSRPEASGSVPWPISPVKLAAATIARTKPGLCPALPDSPPMSRETNRRGAGQAHGRDGFRIGGPTRSAARRLHGAADLLSRLRQARQPFGELAGIVIHVTGRATTRSRRAARLAECSITCAS